MRTSGLVNKIQYNALLLDVTQMLDVIPIIENDHELREIILNM